MKVLAYSAVCFLAFTSCQHSGKNSSDQHSEVKQLKSQLTSFKCDFEDARIAMVKEKYSGNVSSTVNSEWREKVFKYMSLTPDAYLEYIFTTNEVKVSYRSSGGLTTLGGPGPSDRPEGPDRPGRVFKITISSGQPQYNGMLHEIGHAVEPHIDDVHPNTYYKSSKYWYKAAAKTSNKESSAMWQYPKTGRFEYWAELFDSYYCSAESRAHMKKTYPRSFQFAKRFLIDPLNMSAPSESSAAYKIVNDRQGDEDQDGIINSEDECSATDEGAITAESEKYLGCGSGQYKDNLNSYIQE